MIVHLAMTKRHPISGSCVQGEPHSVHLGLYPPINTIEFIFSTATKNTGHVRRWKTVLCYALVLAM